MKFDNATLSKYDGMLRLENSTGEGSGYAIEINKVGVITLLSWPPYGGLEREEGVFDTVEEAVKCAESWT